MYRLSAEPRAASRARILVSLIAAAAFSTLVVPANQAHAQSAPLPPITVEGKAPPKAKQKAKAKAAPASKAAPAVAPIEVVEPAPATAAREATQKDAPYKTPASVSTATRSDIETFGQVDTGDVPRSMPGTFTRENVNNPGIAVNIRGFEGSGRVNMMLNGVRQTFGFVGHEARGFLYVDPLLLSDIDITRGTVITTGGAGSLVGTANFRTLGVEDIIKPGNTSGVLSMATWGSNNLGWSEMAAAAVRNNVAGFGGAISKRDEGNYKNGDGLRVPFTDEDLVSGLFTGYVRPTEFSKLSIDGVLYDNDFSANSYFQNLRAETYTVKYEYRPPNPLVDFKLNAYTTSTEMNYLKGLNSFATQAGRRITVEGSGFDISNRSKLNLGAIGVALEYGGEYFANEISTIKGALNADGENSIAGAFSQATFTYGVFDLIAGLRYDHYTMKGVGNIPPGSGGPGAPFPEGPFAVDDSEGRLNPKLTLAARATDWLQVYATYSEAMRAPTTFETIGGGSHPGTGVSGSLYPNPTLQPETQRGFELGANVRKNDVFASGDTLRFKAAYFDMDVENYVVTCDFAPSVPAFPGATNFYFCNAPGTSRVNGVELQGMYDAGTVFADFSYTYSHSDLPAGVQNFGGHTYLPDHYGSVTLGARFLEQKLTVGVRGFAASEGKDPSRPSGQTEGYALLDVFSSYKLMNGLELGAQVTNVFDTAYTPATTTPGTTTCPTCPSDLELGRGRTFLLTAKTHF